MLLENTRFSNVANKCIGVILVVSIIASTVSLIKSSKDVTFELDNVINFDNSYVESVNSYKINLIKDSIELELKNRGIEGVTVYFSTSPNDKNMVIEKIHLDFQNSEYSLSTTNIDNIKEIVRGAFMIEEECIIIYGQK